MSERVAPAQGTEKVAFAGPGNGEKISPGLTGLSVFGAKIVSIPTGMFFIVMVARTLTLAQFGFWEIIATVLAFSLYPANLISFWTTRDSARGRGTGTTALAANLILSSAGVAIFLSIALLSYGHISVSLYPFLVGSLIVPIGYWYSTAGAILTGLRPQKFGYVLLSGEFSKLATAFSALYLFKMGIIGVVFALGVSNLVQAGLSTYFVRGALTGGLRLSVASRWLRDSWLPGLNSLSYLVSIGDTLLAAIAFGSTLIAGYYQAAFVVATIVSYAFFLSFALYPMLLKGAAEKLVGTLLDVSLMLGIPMAVGATFLAYPILFILNKAYVASSLTLSILAFSTLSLAVSNFFDQSLMGMDTADLMQDRNLQRYLRSNLFFVSAANMSYAIIYVSSVFLLVWLGTSNRLGVQPLTEGWAFIQLLLALGLVGLKLRRLGTGSVGGVGRPLIVYSLSSLAMGVVLYAATPLLIDYSADAAYYGLRLLALVGFGGLVYIGILYSADRRSRAILQKVLRLVFARWSGERPTRSAPPDPIMRV